MRCLCSILLGCLLLGLAGCGSGTSGGGVGGGGSGGGSAGGGAVDKDKLVGKWEQLKHDGLVVRAQWFELTKDGKRKDHQGRDDGTYSVEGDKLTITTPSGEKIVSTIVKLTDKEMQSRDKDNKLDEFVKLP